MTKSGIPWPMVSDGAGSLGKVYGVYDEGNGVNIRGRFLIDPDGVVQAMEVMTPPVGRKIEETIRRENRLLNRDRIWLVKSGKSGNRPDQTYPNRNTEAPLWGRFLVIAIHLERR